ncbi:Disease resistance protein [Quillaja saponaria]|uniref:Disease resistance protein n=1 Tax=Quillaja saponaria TaxID=32244 RepID=A0AAD7PBW6_QUISA|nr:Disease resistance protein [Quillaja saponaria]
MDSLTSTDVNVIGVHGLPGVVICPIIRESHLETKSGCLAWLKQEKRILVILDDLWEGIDLHILGIPIGDDQKGPKKLMAAKGGDVTDIGDDKVELKALMNSGEEVLPTGGSNQVCTILMTSRHEEILSGKMGSEKNFSVGTLHEEEAGALFNKMAELYEFDKNHRLQEIKVLHLSELNLPSLPFSIGLLTNLQTLRLEKCELEDITLIGRLQNLKILSLCWSVIICFPDEIGQLIQLQLLDLSDSKIKEIAPNVLSRLENLQELYMRNSDIHWVVQGSSNESNTCSDGILGELSSLHSLKALEIHFRDLGLLPSHLCFENLRRYKILIGDGWNWPGKFVFSKTLKLKLKKNIHRVAAIKMLLKTVEELYLGELECVGSVLYDMNEEGFPYLKFLDIQNNSEIEYIVKTNWIYPQDAFPMLESLVLQNLINLKNIWHGPVTTALFCNLRIIKVERCDWLKSLISFFMVGCLSQVVEIDVSQCTFIEEIVSGEEMSDGNVGTPVNEISFPALRSLTLQCLPLLTNFYLDNKSCSSSQLEAARGNGFRHIFTASVAKGLQKLEKLEIKSCDSLEEIVEEEGGEKAMEFELPQLISIELSYLDSLRSFYGGAGGYIIKCPQLKILQVYKCPKAAIFMKEESFQQVCNHGKRQQPFFSPQKVAFHDIEYLSLSEYPMLKDVLNNRQSPLKLFKLKYLRVWDYEFASSAIFSPTLLQSLNNLEDIRVDDSDSVVQVFDLEGLGIDGHVGLLPLLKKLKLESLPNLMQIWSKEPNGILDLKNLISLTIHECHSLRNLFTSSMVLGLMGLQEMEIRQCNGIEEIITKASTEDDAATSTVSKIIFPQLNLIVLHDLPNLTCFYSGSDTLECPSLKRICKENCPRMKAFDIIEAPNTSIANISNSKSSINYLRLSKHPELKDIWQDGLLTRPLSILKSLAVDNYINGNLGLLSMLLDFRLVGLPKLNSIWSKEPQGILDLSNLEILKVGNLSSLPNVFTLSMVSGLRKLGTIEIENCNGIEEIIIEARDDVENEGIMKFQSLEYIILKSLPYLVSFYSGSGTLEYPLSRKITLIGCPKMKKFSSTFSAIIEQETIDNQQSRGKQGQGEVDGFPMLYELILGFEDAMNEMEKNEEGTSSEERAEKKTSTQNLEEKVNLFCGQDQSPGTEYDSRETPDATLSKETREPKSHVIVPTVDETKSPEAETTITIPRGLGFAVDFTPLVQDDDRAHISPPIDPPMKKPAHASELIVIRNFTEDQIATSSELVESYAEFLDAVFPEFPSQVTKLASTSAQSPETISKEDQIPIIDDLQGKESVIRVYEESSNSSGSNLPVQHMHNSPQLATLVSSKVTTTTRILSRQERWWIFKVDNAKLINLSCLSLGKLATKCLT